MVNVCNIERPLINHQEKHKHHPWKNGHIDLFIEEQMQMENKHIYDCRGN